MFALHCDVIKHGMFTLVSVVATNLKREELPTELCNKCSQFILTCDNLENEEAFNNWWDKVHYVFE